MTQKTIKKLAKPNPAWDKEFFRNLADVVVAKLFEEKAEEICRYEMRDDCSIGYYSVVASGASARHVSAMTEQVVDVVRQMEKFQLTIDGQSSGQWVVIDLAGIMIHIFQPIYRDVYDIEGFWEKMGFIERSLTARPAGGQARPTPVDLFEDEIADSEYS